jgi:hypothetical protein
VRTNRSVAGQPPALRNRVPRASLWDTGRRAMQKVILISILFANVVIPLLAARERSAKRGLKKTLVYMVAFNVIYLLALMFIYPRLQ